MPDKIKFKIRKFKDSDTRKAALLIRDTFAKFNRKEGSKKGVRWYVGLYDPTKTDVEGIRRNFSRTRIFFVASFMAWYIYPIRR